jgi:hypothetical protein
MSVLIYPNDCIVSELILNPHRLEELMHNNLTMMMMIMMMMMIIIIGVLGFDSRRGLGIFLFTTASRTALGPTQPPIQWIPGALSLGANRQGCEADHSTFSSAEVKECVELYLHSPIRLHGVVLS